MKNSAAICITCNYMSDCVFNKGEMIWSCNEYETESNN